MLTNGQSKKTQYEVGTMQGYENRGGESVSPQSKEESPRSLLHVSAIVEFIQWSTCLGELTDVDFSCDADTGSLVSRHDPTLLSPQYGTQAVALANATSKAASNQWLSTETLGHQPRPYFADIPLEVGEKELLTKYQLLKGIASDANEKANAFGSEFGSEGQYTRQYSISVAREVRKPRVIPAPERNALYLPPLLSTQYGTQTVALPNATSKADSDQWLSTETVGQRPRPYSADIRLGGGKELTKYQLAKGIVSDANEKANAGGSEFGSEDQYTRQYSISVAREVRKQRVIPAPEWNALYLPTPAPKWQEIELPDQPTDLCRSRNLEKNKSSYAGGILSQHWGYSAVTQEEPVHDRHLQTSLESCLNEQYQLKSFPVLSPQVVDETSVDSGISETSLLSLTDDQNAFSSASRSLEYMQDVSLAENTAGRKKRKATEDPQSPEIHVSACSPVSTATLEENSYNQENVENGTSNEEIQSSVHDHGEFMVPSSSSSIEEGKCICLICNESFANSTHLRLHVKTHLEMPFRCDSCAMCFGTKRNLRRHEKTYGHQHKTYINSYFGTSTVDDPRPFKCTDCKTTYCSRENLSKHLRSEKHIKKLDYLGKLPFGMYAKMERSSEVCLIDTTDCNDTLASLQVMVQKLY